MALGDAYLDFDEEDPNEILEAALVHYQAAHLAHGIYTKDIHPLKWAEIHLNLGVAYAGSIARHDEQCRNRCCRLEAVLEVFTKDTDPEKFGEVQESLGSAFIHQPAGNASEKIEASIRHGKAVLEVCAKPSYPDR